MNLQKDSQLIVHAGTAKTGTTSLHYSLYKLAPWLLGKGINYPNLNGSGFGWTAERGRSAGNADPTYPGVDWYAAPWVERFKWMLDQSLKVSMANEKIVLSSEMLSALCTEQEFWKSLKNFEMQTGRHVRVIIYVRDPFSMFLTCFQQNVKMDGFSGEADEFIDLFVKEGRVSRFFLQLNLPYIFQMARDASIQFEVYRYEDTLPLVEKHFFQKVLGVSYPEELCLPKKFNSSLSCMEIDFHRGVNSIDPNLGQIFGYERSDSHLSRNVSRYVSEYRLHLDATGRVKLESIFQEYKRLVSEYLDFASRIDFSVKEEALQSVFTPEQAQTRLEVFELGRFVALSYKNGYLDWAMKRKEQ